jgi:hypothetical protein
MNNIYYKYYELDKSNPFVKNGLIGFRCTKFIRECVKKGNLFYTISIFAEKENGQFEKYNRKKIPSGSKFIRDLTKDDVAAKIFVSVL